MGVLAKKDMLYFLIISVVISLLAPVLIFADEQRISFFTERNTSAQPEECSECSKEPINLNPELKKKTEEIEKALHSKFSDREKEFNNEVILFIDPDSRLSDAAVKALVKFKKDFPSWNVKGVILTNAVNLKEKLLRKQSYFSNDIEFSIDLNGNLARQFAVTKTPAYVITYQNKRYKIEGQPDLNEFISKLDK
jgi:hypothetical protein